MHPNILDVVVITDYDKKNNPVSETGFRLPVEDDFLCTQILSLLTQAKTAVEQKEIVKGFKLSKRSFSFEGKSYPEESKPARVKSRNGYFLAASA
jgi:hypothetical protein